MMSDHLMRQLTILSSLIADFRGRTISLNKLIMKVEGISEHCIDKNFKRFLTAKVSDLEELNAFTFEGEPLSQADLNSIEDTIDEISVHISELIDKNADSDL